jgi:hypothetical protein
MPAVRQSRYRDRPARSDRQQRETADRHDQRAPRSVRGRSFREIIEVAIFHAGLPA